MNKHDVVCVCVCVRVGGWVGGWVGACVRACVCVRVEGRGAGLNKKTQQTRAHKSSYTTMTNAFCSNTYNENLVSCVRSLWTSSAAQIFTLLKRVRCKVPVRNSQGRRPPSLDNPTIVECIACL